MNITQEKKKNLPTVVRCTFLIVGKHMESLTHFLEHGLRLNAALFASHVLVRVPDDSLNKKKNWQVK